VTIELDGKDIIDWGFKSIYWKVTPNWTILELHLNRKADPIVINYPIELIWLEFKNLSIKSNNTPRGTKFFWDGKVIDSHGIIEFEVDIGDADKINQITLKMC